jgi:hypothetical protein
VAISRTAGVPPALFVSKIFLSPRSFCLQVKRGRDARGPGMRAPLWHARRLGGRHVSLRILLEQEAFGLKGLR